MDMIVFALQCQFVSIDHHYRNTLHDETMHRIKSRDTAQNDQIHEVTYLQILIFELQP